MVLPGVKPKTLDWTEAEPMIGSAIFERQVFIPASMRNRTSAPRAHESELINGARFTSLIWSRARINRSIPSKPTVVTVKTRESRAFIS